MTEPLTLRRGAHPTRDAGMCAMEAVAYIAGEPHSDEPTCACPIIAAFIRRWNDDLPDDGTRTRLLGPLVPRLVGTRSAPEVERRRSMLALDWAVREYTPAWLDLRPGLAVHAEALRALPEIADLKTAKQARPVVGAAAAAARDAAAATCVTAWGAARAAALAAAEDAAAVTAWAAAGPVVRFVARAAGLAVAWDAALAAARTAAEVAARSAARAAAWNAARDAARTAARDALAPTTARLQESALRLVERMIAVTA